VFQKKQEKNKNNERMVLERHEAKAKRIVSFERIKNQ